MKNIYTILIMVLLLGFSCQQLKVDPVHIDGSNGVRPLVEALVESFSQISPEIDIRVGEGMNTRTRLEALKNDSIDIAMASHGLNIDELTQQGYQVIRFAQMPVVFASNKEVAITNLSEQQVCEIYSGQLKNWNEVGGNDLAIEPLSRPFEEVDVEVIIEHIACFSEITLDSMVRFEETSGQLARALAGVKGGIGMTTMTRVTQSDGQLKAIALNGYEPSTDNIQAGQYKLVRNSYLVLKDNPNKSVQTFLNFINSDKGIETLLQNLAIPVLDDKNRVE